MDNHLEENVT